MIFPIPLRLQLIADGADCTHCPLAKAGLPARPVATEWRGKDSPEVAIVGEAPGRREVQMGRPFIGPSGKLLDYACQKGGVSRSHIAILNAAACGPIPSLAEGMKRDATAACRPRLLTELRRLQPRVILAVGSFALRALGRPGLAGVSTVRGALLSLADDVGTCIGGNHVVELGRVGHGASKEIGSPIAGNVPPLTHALATVGAELDPLPSRSTSEGEGCQGEVASGNALKPIFSPFRSVELTSRPRFKPYFLATFHPAHILRGGDGDAPDQPGGESAPAVDLLFYFFLYDLAKAQRLARGEITPWEDALDLFAVKGNELVNPVFTDDDELIEWTPTRPTALTDAIERVYSEAEGEEHVACDVETDSLDAIAANLTAVGFATTEGGVSATWGAWQLSRWGGAAAKDLLADTHIHKVFHNRIYDTIVLPRHQWPVHGPVDDTLLQHHAAFPGLPHKLQQVATQFFVTRPWKDEFRRTEKDEASLILYNGRDTMATARLRVALDKVIDSGAKGGRPTATRRVYEADRQQFAVATQMRRFGYYVDRVEQARQSAIQRARLNYMREALIGDFREIEPRWRDALARILAQTQRKGDSESYAERVIMRHAAIATRKVTDTQIGLFKPKAHKDMIALFEVLRIPILDYSKKTGLPKTDKKALEAGAARHPFLRRIIHLKEAKHILATYIDGLPIKDDGRVHPDWGPKITGRWGAGKAQNWPRFVHGWPPKTNADGTYRTRPSGELITPTENPRRIVAAPTAADVLRLPFHAVPASIRLRAMSGHGRILLGGDFSQLELRIAGYLSRDAFLLDVFRRDIDPHAAFAHQCFPKQMPQLEADFIGACAAAGNPRDARDKPLKIKVVGGKPEEADIIADPHLRENVIAPALRWYRLRDLTKRAEYCGIYGGGAEVVYDSIVKDFPEVKLKDLADLIANINQVMSGVVRWRNEQEGLARINREIREKLLGRARLFPLGNFNPNIVYNFPIQAMAASLLAFAIFRFIAVTQPDLLQLGRLYEFGLLSASWVVDMRKKGLHLWRAPVELNLNGHDSLLGECDEEDGDQGVKVLGLSMEQELPMDNGEMMKFPADPAKGRRWSDT